MPELPQIPIQPVALRQRELDIPYDPRPRAIRNTALITDKVVSELADTILVHKQIIDDKKAINELFDAESNLRMDVGNIKDIPTATSVYTTGINDIRGNLQQNYPNLSELTHLQISRIADKKLQSFTHGMIIKQNTQNTKDIEAVIPDTIDQINRAPDVETRQEVTSNGYNFIERMKNAGVLDDYQATALKHKLTNAKFDSEAVELATQHPTEFGQFSAEQLGVTEKRRNELANVAVGTRERKIVTDGLAYKEEKAAFTNQVLEGKYIDNPAMLENLRAANYITEGVYRAAQIRVPPDDRAKNNLERILKDTDWDTKENLIEFKNNWISGNHTLNTEDRKYLMLQVQNKLNELGDPISRNSFDLDLSLKNYGATVGSVVLSNSRYVAKEKEIYYNLITSAKRRMDDAKDFDLQFKIYKETVEEIDKLFGVGVKSYIKKPGDNVHNLWNSSWNHDAGLK